MLPTDALLVIRGTCSLAVIREIVLLNKGAMRTRSLAENFSRKIQGEPFHIRMIVASAYDEATRHCLVDSITTSNLETV